MIRLPISKLHVSVAIAAAFAFSTSLPVPPAYCAPKLIAQYSSSGSTSNSETQTTTGSETQTTTSTRDTSSTEDSPEVVAAKQSAKEQLQHQRDQQFMRLLLIGVFIFFAAIAFAGYLSIPRRKQGEESSKGTANDD